MPLSAIVPKTKLVAIQINIQVLACKILTAQLKQSAMQRFYFTFNQFAKM